MNQTQQALTSSPPNLPPPPRTTRQLVIAAALLSLLGLAAILGATSILSARAELRSRAAEPPPPPPTSIPTPPPSPTQAPTTAPDEPLPPTASPTFFMRMPPPDKICAYPAVFLLGPTAILGDGTTNPLEIAASCDTKVIVQLFRRTDQILQDDGTGLDLERLEEHWQPYLNRLDPYVADGTVVAHRVLDEPHDCSDWGGDCPTKQQVDEAARRSKLHWPTLPTMTQTLPGYLNGYDWQELDLAHFQYAFHKGPLERFLADAVALLTDGTVQGIVWSLQALAGGCPKSGDCPMTPDQVRQVGTAMCATGRGSYLGFSRYDLSLLTPEMLQAVEDFRQACGGI